MDTVRHRVGQPFFSWRQPALPVTHPLEVELLGRAVTVGARKLLHSTCQHVRLPRLSRLHRLADSVRRLVQIRPAAAAAAMLLICGYGKRVRAMVGDPILIGRGSTGMIPPDPWSHTHRCNSGSGSGCIGRVGGGLAAASSCGCRSPRLPPSASLCCVSVSRGHVRIDVLSSQPLSVRLTQQKTKHPTLVYRRADLAAIGWIAREQEQPQEQSQPLPQPTDAHAEGTDAAADPASPAGVAATASAEQLAARDRLALRLHSYESVTLEAGDAFGIRGETLLWPFWIAELPPPPPDKQAAAPVPAAAATSAMAAPAPPAAAASTAAAVTAADCADSHSSNSSNAPFTPPRRRGSRSPTHVSCASLSSHSLSRRLSSSSAAGASPSAAAAAAAAAAPVPCAGAEAGVMGPVSPFYQTLRTDSLRAAMAAARRADGGQAVPTPATALLLREAAAAEDEADRRRQREEASLWNLDQYSHAKRRKITPAAQVGAAAAAGAAGVQAAASSAAVPAASSASLSGMAQSHSRPALARATAAAAAASSNAASVAPPFASSSPAPAVSSAVAGPPPDTSPAPPTLALPCLSTGDFHFLPEKACPIAERAVRFFLQCHAGRSDVRVTMLLPALASGELTESGRAVASYLDVHPIDERFSWRACSDPSALGALGVGAAFLVHATTYRFQGGEGGAINRHMEGEFGQRMHGAHGAARTGRAYTSRVDPHGALALRCPGLRFLLSVRPPNMNPARPDCLAGDYLKGCKELRETYDAVFKQFAELAGLDRRGNGAGAPAGTGTGPTAAGGAAAHAEPATATTGAGVVPVTAEEKDPVLDSASQRGSSQPRPAAASAHSPSPPAAAATAAAAAASPRPASSPGSASSSSSASGLCSFVPPASGLPPYRPPATPPPKPSGHFSALLYAYIKQPRPAALQPSVLWEDDGQPAAAVSDGRGAAHSVVGGLAPSHRLM